MIINEYVKRWYDENYDVRDEDFYIDNARWVVERHWVNGGVKHGIFTGIIGALGFLFSCYDISLACLNSMTILAIFTICFFFYGIREYDANNWQTSKMMYIFTFIFIITIRGKVGSVLQWIFAVGGTVLYFYLTFIKPGRFKKLKKVMQEKIAKMEAAEEKANRESYAKWEEEYKAFRYGLPESDIPDGDPNLEEAKKLFKGYDSSKDMLKNRYRHLAKQYHPDNGGDEYMFQCIIEVYEELCQQFT